MALIIMFNNFFHDFTAALWLALSILLIYLEKRINEANSEEVNRFYLKVFPTLYKWSIIALFANLALGVVRALAYYQYEYVPAAGKDQILALILKHILLVAVVLVGIINSRRLQKNYSKLKEVTVCQEYY